MKKLVGKNNSLHFNANENLFISGNKTKLCCFLMTIYFYLISAQSELKSFYSCMLWHSRFGHASIGVLRKLKNDNSIYNLEVFSNNENREPCQSCALNKSTIENISKASRDISKKKFDLIYSDICGPFPKTVENRRYMLSFRDDHTTFARLSKKYQRIPFVLWKRKCKISSF